MIFNTIMVQLDVDSPAAPRTTYALDLARRFEATLIGFAAADSYVFVPGDDGGIAANFFRALEVGQHQATVRRHSTGGPARRWHRPTQGVGGRFRVCPVRFADRAQ